MVKYEEPGMEILYIEEVSVITTSVTGELNWEEVGGDDGSNWSEWF